MPDPSNREANSTTIQINEWVDALTPARSVPPPTGSSTRANVSPAGWNVSVGGPSVEQVGQEAAYGCGSAVGELSTRSTEFRARWGAHNVRHHGTGAKRFHHHIVGDLTLAYEGLEVAAESGLTLTIYAAEPGSPSEDALRLLASWAASHGRDLTAPTLAID